ncbi:MAG: TSCPD domain-containing protein [Zetaproteobacteria bacterium]|nr:TSCPD domain-containing protein [Zetaproteobacteria bacterium]
MATQINKKITAFEVLNKNSPSTTIVQGDTQPQTIIAPLLERDDVLEGSTYKIKTPHSEHALYITINDVIIDDPVTGATHRRPFEVFINSKNMEHFMWIVALTRVISAIFRKGGDITFLVEELKAVFDPQGGYYKRGGKYMPSLVAEIGEVIQQHLVSIGMMEGNLASPELELKKQKIKERFGDETMKNAHICPKCATKSLIRMDGCDTCLECGHSKCG